MTAVESEVVQLVANAIERAKRGEAGEVELRQIVVSTTKVRELGEGAHVHGGQRAVAAMQAGDVPRALGVVGTSASPDVDPTGIVDPHGGFPFGLEEPVMDGHLAAVRLDREAPGRGDCQNGNSAWLISEEVSLSVNQLRAWR